MFEAHLGGGFTAAMQTFTVSHDLGDDLEQLRRLVADAFRAILAGRRWRSCAERYGRQVRRRDRTGARAGRERLTWELGTIRALEVTHGRHGWHPHLHVLFFFDRELSAEELEAFGRSNAELWARLARQRAGKTALLRLCPIERIKDGSADSLAKYLAKFSLELARADMKESRDHHRGRQPFDILESYAAAEDSAAKRRELLLWHRWEEGIRGAKAITWSRGLRDRFHIAERTDQELAEEEVGGELLLELTGQQWRELLRRPGAAVELLEALESGGAEAGRAFLAAIEASSSKYGRGPP